VIDALVRQPEEIRNLPEVARWRRQRRRP
jgi:hypothetical protein